MSYESDECQLLIDEAIHNYFHDETETEMDVKDCFFEIREQAAKADEYEAKAEAFDEICKAHVPLEKRMSPVTVDEGLDFAVETEKIILKYYESGDYDAKK